MARFIRGRSRKKGLPPGSLVYIADHPYSNVKITMISYSKDRVEEKTVQRIEECVSDARASHSVTWINIEGLANTEVIKSVGEVFEVHDLWLEDVLNTDHRPKVEELDELLLVIIKAISERSKNKRIFFEQVSLLLTENFLISFQEYPGDLFETVKARIHQGKGRIRGLGADYLFYVLIDVIVDGYFGAIEKLGQQVEGIEGKITADLNSPVPEEIYFLKSELLYLVKSAIPIREAIQQICRTKRSDLKEETKLFLQDAHEHTVQVVDVIETYRQVLTSLMELHQTKVNGKMNEIMKVLTIFSTIFIPLTFIVGIYGMNFTNMPELTWKYGYTLSWLLMVGVTSTMILYFRKKKWL